MRNNAINPVNIRIFIPFVLHPAQRMSGNALRRNLTYRFTG
jgi:hypothetical protein